MRPDLCAVDNNIDPKKYLGSFYTDSLVHDEYALKMLTDVIGKVSEMVFSPKTTSKLSLLSLSHSYWCKWEFPS